MEGLPGRTEATRPERVDFVVSDDHAGLRAAIREVLAEAALQRYYVHFLRKRLDHLPRKADDGCMTQLRCIYHRRTIEEARRQDTDCRSSIRIT